MKNIALRLHELVNKHCPGADVSIVDVNDANSWIIHYPDNATEKQKTAVQNALSAIDLDKLPDDYRRLRASEYPAIGDQLDAIIKGFNQMRLGGADLPEDLDVIINKCLAVKNKYPKDE